MLRSAFVCFAVVCCLAKCGSAAIVLSVAQSVPGPITVGNAVDFTVSIRSNSGNISDLALLGFTVSVGSGGGRFVSGTGIQVPGSHAFFGPPPTNTLPSNLVGYSYSASPGVSVSGSSFTEFVRFRLDTTNATIGDYSVTISAADAADSGFSSLGAVTPSPFNYSIVAVPEPSSLLLLFGSIGFVGRQVLKRRGALCSQVASSHKASSSFSN